MQLGHIAQHADHLLILAGLILHGVHKGNHWPCHWPNGLRAALHNARGVVVSKTVHATTRAGPGHAARTMRKRRVMELS